MAYEGVIICLLIVTCSTAPLDDPIRIDLPVYDQPQTTTDELLLAEPLKPENYPGGEPLNKKQPTGGNFVTYKLQAATNLLGGAANAKVLFKVYVCYLAP